MKRWLLIAIAVLIFALLAYGGYTELAAPDPTPTVAPLPTEEVVWATGKVVPARRATLSFAVGGTLAGVMVREGDEVDSGQILALLNDSHLETAVTQAEAALELARARKDQIVAGANVADISALRESVRAAEADAAAAEARMRGAQAEVDRALSELARVVAAAGEVTRGPTDRELQLAKTELDMAKDRLFGAQAQRDTIGGALDRGEARQSDYDQAKAAVLEAEDAVRAAELRYQDFLEGASESERTSASSTVASARAAVNAARAQVDSLESLRDAARARAQEATARLVGLEGGPTLAALRVADAEVRSAEVNLRAAEDALAQTRLQAPFSGTVGAVLALSSEVVTPGQPIVTIGDLEHLRVETSDLRETDVVKVEVDQRVDITFDSLPELSLSGRVDRIAPMASPGQGGTSYTVWVEFEELDPRVRWGMTAYPNIHVDE